MRIQNSFSVKYFALFTVIFLLGANTFAQTKVTGDKPSVKTDLPKITQVDENTVKELFAVKKENAKPLLVNFWATWCVPCREEFPDLVKIDEEYRGKIDFITITLDDPAELSRDVPQFLAEMKAKMPTYLLYTSKESEVIGAISKEWSGGLPFTVLYNEKREITYAHQGVVKTDILKAKINELIQNSSSEIKPTEVSYKESNYNLSQLNAEIVYVFAGRMDRYFQQTFVKVLKDKYGISVKLVNLGCSPSSEMSYNLGNNEVIRSELEKRFGEDIIEKAKTEARELTKDQPPSVVELKLTVN